MRTTKCTVSLLAAAAALVLCGSARAADFTVGFSDCPSTPFEAAAGSDVTYTLTGSLASANIEGTDGAQGWSFGVQITNGEFASFDTTITIPTLFQKTSGGALTEKDLVIDDAAFYSAELIPIQDPQTQPYTGFVTGIVFSTSKKQVLHPSGSVGTVHLNVKSTIPATEGEEKKVLVEYKNGLQGSGQPVDNVVTFNSDSITPVAQACEATLKVKSGPKPTFAVAIYAENEAVGATEGTNTVFAKEVKPGATTFPAIVKLTTDQLPGADGPQGWSLGIANGPCVTVNPDTGIDFEGLVVPTMFEKVKGQPLIQEDFNVGDSAFLDYQVSRTAGSTGDPTGVVVAVVLSQSKKRVLLPNRTDTILRLKYEMAVVKGANPDCTVAFQNGLQGAGQPVENVVTQDSESMAPNSQGLIFRITGSDEPPPPTEVTFRQGDANNDGKIDVADPIFVVYAVVPGLDTTGIYKFACEFAGDANQDGSVNLADAIYLIDYEFRGGAAPVLGCASKKLADPVKCPETFVCK